MKVYAAERNYDGGGSYETTIISLHLNRSSAEEVSFNEFEKEYNEHMERKNRLSNLYKYEPEITFYGTGGGAIGLRSWTVTEYEVQE